MRFAASPTPGTGLWMEFSGKQSCIPIIQYEKQIALRSSNLRSFQGPQNRQTFSHSADLLTHDYGRLLDPNLMIADPFYAMHEIFKFSAHSESQFLNMVESVIAPETGFNVLHQGVLTLSNLLYHQEILEAHAISLREQVDVIKRRGGQEWKSRCTPAQRERTEAAAIQLQKDFEDLLSRAGFLIRRCENGMKVIINKCSDRSGSESKGSGEGHGIRCHEYLLSFMFHYPS